MKIELIENYSSGFFLLYLIISGNFLGSTFSCGFQNKLSQNILLRYFLIFFSLFFFVMLSRKDAENNNPFESLLSTIPVFLLYLISIKCKTNFLLSIIIIVFTIYFINLYKEYRFKTISPLLISKELHSNNIQDIKNNLKKEYKHNNNVLGEINSLDLYLVLNYMQYILAILAFILLLIGFIININENRRKPNFSFTDFMFSNKRQCFES
tara:strand:- start:295 stop:924 length:630 start_codon:yes stop_codon:yes gene_type:complete